MTYLLSLLITLFGLLVSKLIGYRVIPDAPVIIQIIIGIALIALFVLLWTMIHSLIFDM